MTARSIEIWGKVDGGLQLLFSLFVFTCGIDQQQFKGLDMIAYRCASGCPPCAGSGQCVTANVYTWAGF